jgi:hypothetical protein
MQLVPCLHKICVACMMRCNVRACITCGIAVSGVKSSPAVDTTCRNMVIKNAFDYPLFRDGWELVYDLDPWCYVALPHELVLSDHLLNMQGLMERVSDQRCQLMVVCRGAEAIVRCSPCMHAIACRGCLLASMTLLKNCTTCGYMIEHFKFV